MPDGKLSPEHEAELAKLEKSLSKMSDDALAQATQSALGSFSKVTSEEFGPNSMEKFAELIASTPDDVFTKMADADSKADFEERSAFRRRKQQLHLDAIKRRHMKFAWNSDTGKYGLVPDPTPAPPDAASGALSFEPRPDEPGDPSIETGHYDDGHTFGWKKQPERDVDEDDDDTDEPRSEKSSLPVPVPLIGIGAAGLLLVAGLLLFNRPATVAGDVATLAPSTQSAAAAATAAATARVGLADPCALVTAAESSAILERPVTPSVASPGLQCFYRPASPATWSFQEGSNTGKLRIDSILITIATGNDAKTRFDAKQAIYGKDPTSDEIVNGLGDRAIFTAGSEVSVLSGTRFINVRAQGDYDWGDGSKRYENVHQKLIGVLVAFAKSALPRMP